VLALVTVAGIFWNTPLVFPVKAFVVLLHEAGHAAAAIVTGGSVDRIELTAELGGLCVSRGGWRPVVLAAGYLGSMLFGGSILVAAARSRRDARLAVALGLAVVVLTVVLVRTAFGILFGVLFGAGLLAAARWLPDVANDVLLKFLGLCSVAYAVMDIKDDLVIRTVPGSDAWQMSHELFLPAVFWGVLWLVAAVVAGVVAVGLAARAEVAKALPPQQ
jgi:hypothetical protein